MEPTLPTISLLRLAVAFIPVAAVLAILLHWSLGAWNALYATARMLIQLLIVGYVLTFVFAADQPYLVLAVLVVMMAAAAWIALRPLGARTPRRLGLALAAISASGILALALTTQGVLALDPWYEPRFLVPLAGMTFSTAMNAVSLAAERRHAELAAGTAPAAARRRALETALIPQLNSLFAVGLVNLPGMMTGQILSGAAPLIAVRYQIMVMAVLFGVAGMSAALYLWLSERFDPGRQRRTGFQLSGNSTLRKRRPSKKALAGLAGTKTDGEGPRSRWRVRRKVEAVRRTRFRAVSGCSYEHAAGDTAPRQPRG